MYEWLVEEQELFKWTNSSNNQNTIKGVFLAI